MTTRSAPAPVPVPASASAPASFSPRPDIRLVVTDMDGTLLDADGRVPEGLWPLLAELRRRGVVFSPASGRQYATLAHLFVGADDGMVYIAENGAFVVRDGVEVSSDPLDPAVAARLVKSVRQLTDEGVDVGVVVCGKRAAYIERGDQAFLDEVGRYYNAHRLVDDATAVDDEIVKVAVFDFGPIERTTAPALASFADTHQVVVSSEHWIDVMNHTADKGVAVRRPSGAPEHRSGPDDGVRGLSERSRHARRRRLVVRHGQRPPRRHQPRPPPGSRAQRRRRRPHHQERSGHLTPGDAAGAWGRVRGRDAGRVLTARHHPGRRPPGVRGSHSPLSRPGT